MSLDLVVAYCFLALVTIGAALVMLIYSKKIMCLSAVIESFERPVLYYDERDRLQIISKGLVYFDRNGLSSIAKPPVKPTGSQAVVGEIVIDSNRYRYRTKSLEYKPGAVGTIIYLEYLGSAAAK
jgi:hypothetical protein